MPKTLATEKLLSLIKEPNNSDAPRPMQELFNEKMIIKEQEVSKEMSVKFSQMQKWHEAEVEKKNGIIKDRERRISELESQIRSMSKKINSLNENNKNMIDDEEIAEEKDILRKNPDYFARI